MMTKTSDSSSTDSLPDIHSPADVKGLGVDQLPALAEKIRHTLIETLSETGGHLGPNLGVVELTIAMHRVFDTPKDKFVWDVAHQAYVLFVGQFGNLPLDDLRKPAGNTC